MIQEESLQSQQTLRTINEYLMDMYKQGKLKRRTMETKDIKLPDKYQTPDWLFEKQEQPSLPSDLDEAAHNFEDNALSDYDDIVVTEDGEERPVLKYNFTDAFKAGAEWMAGHALTTDDIKLIAKIHYELVFKDTTGVKVGDVPSEVLRRFNELRKK